MRRLTASCLGLLTTVLATSGCDRLGGGETGICLAVAHPAERELPAKVKTIAVMQFTSATPESKATRPPSPTVMDSATSSLRLAAGPVGMTGA